MMLALFFLLFTGSSQFIPPDSDFLKKGIDQIYSIRFQEASATFQTYQKRFPNRPEGYFFESMVVWWQVLLTSDNEAGDSLFFTSADKTIARLEAISNANRNRQVADYYIAGCYGFKARLYGIREKWFSAARNGSKAFPVLESGLEGGYDFIDARFGTGIYRYYAARIPEKYPIIKPIMALFPDGDRESGLQDLETVMTNGYFTRFESAWFLMQIQLNYEFDFEKARSIGEFLSNRFPQNPLIRLSYGNALFRTGKREQAEQVFAGFLVSIDSGTPYFLPQQKVQCSYFLAEIRQAEKKDKAALALFESAIQVYVKSPQRSQISYYIESLIEAGMIYKKLGQKEEANKKFQLVLKYPNQHNWHQRAKDGLKS